MITSINPSAFFIPGFKASTLYHMVDNFLNSELLQFKEIIFKKSIDEAAHS